MRGKSSQVFSSWSLVAIVERMQGADCLVAQLPVRGDPGAGRVITCEEVSELTHYGSTHTGRVHFRACNEGSRSQPTPGSYCSSRPGGPTVCGDGQPDEVLSVAVAEPVAGVVITGALTSALVISPVLVVVSTAVVGGRQLPTRADQVPSSPDA